MTPATSSTKVPTVKPGLLFDNRSKRHPADVAVAMAKRQFITAEHLQAYQPKEVYFAPEEKPEEDTIAGLKVCTSKDLKPGYLRVCTNVTIPLDDL